MTPEDRDLLRSLRQQQAELQQSLERLNAQLSAVEVRAAAASPETTEVVLPPLPPEAFLPPIPADPLFPPIPTLPPVPAPRVPPVRTPPPPAPKASVEMHFGRWLIRIGVLFGVILMGLVLASSTVQRLLGHAGLLSISAIFSLAAVMVGGRLARKGRPASSHLLGHIVTAAALTWLYLTLYAGCYDDPLRVTTSPLLAGFVLLLWSIYVFLLAERRPSQVLAFFAIVMAYVSAAITPNGAFNMSVDLVLAAMSAVYLFRNGWISIPIVGVLGTYFALLCRLVIDDDGELVLDSSRTLPFWPHASYLIIAWFIFTTATILTSAPSFRGGQRLAFLSLNNAGLAGLLALTAYIAGYGAGSIGWTLLDTGLVFLVVSRFAGFAEIDPVDIMGAYAAQGLALFTAGIIVVFTGITRSFALLIETFLLGVAGAFAGDRILTISTYVAAFFATVFSIWEITMYGHHPWLLGFGGALIMLINAWNCRSEIRHSATTRTSIVVSTTCFCIFGVSLVFSPLYSQLDDATLPPALAFAALILTFAIYQFDIFELPGLAQLLLLAAQLLVLFPVETGEELPWWSIFWVAFITLLLVTWWSRQRFLLTGPWKLPLAFIYALALVYLTVQTVHPYLGAQGWMVVSALLSFAFLFYGAFTRTWPLAAAGQVLLVLSLYHFFFPPQPEVFPWAWWAAAAPVVVTYVTARCALQWLRCFPEIRDSFRDPFRLLACGYLIVATLGLARWVFGIVHPKDQVAALLFLGTFILSTNVRHASSFGVRCSFVLSALGMLLYFDTLSSQAHALSTVLNGLAMLLFLCQAALLRQEGKSLVTPLETWALILFSVGTSWLFVSAWVWTRINPGDLTMTWALYAFFLFLFGMLIHERRFRWCSLAILFIAIARLLFHDFWGLSGGFRVLTLFILTLIALVIGAMLLRRTTRETLL